jgi:predicted anti-sigma-YlaC factor YlaD
VPADRDHPGVKCGRCQDALSACLDGEGSAAEREEWVEELLRTCACCRGYNEHAAQVTRLSRTTVAAEGPDLVDAVLSVAPRGPGSRPVSVLRPVLAVVGLVQAGVGLSEVSGVVGSAGSAGMRMAGTVALTEGRHGGPPFGAALRWRGRVR